MMVVYPNLLLLLCASLSTATIWILVGPVRYCMTAVVGRHRHQGSTRQLVTISDMKSKQGCASDKSALLCIMLSSGPPHSGGTSEIFSSGDDRDGGAAAGSSTRFSDTCDACVPTFLSERSCPGPDYQKVAVAGESRGQSPVSVNIRQC